MLAAATGRLGIRIENLRFLFQIRERAGIPDRVQQYVYAGFVLFHAMAMSRPKTDPCMMALKPTMAATGRPWPIIAGLSIQARNRNW